MSHNERMHSSTTNLTPQDKTAVNNKYGDPMTTTVSPFNAAFPNHRTCSTQRPDWWHIQTEDVARKHIAECSKLMKELTEYLWSIETRYLTKDEKEWLYAGGETEPCHNYFDVEAARLAVRELLRGNDLHRLNDRLGRLAFITAKREDWATD